MGREMRRPAIRFPLERPGTPNLARAGRSLIRNASLGCRMRTMCVAVPKAHAEETRRRILAMGLLRRGVPVERDGETVFLPVTSSVAIGYPTVERDVRAAPPPIRSYKDIVQVPAELKPLLPTSFDVIGDIALVKIPDELAAFDGDIAAAILRANSAVKVVAADGGVKGDLRVRQIRILAGPDRTETVYREHGLSYRVDVARAYFSPRLGTERLRVAEQVQPGEVVVDLFAGVGPYAILIAKRRQPRVVYAFDANADAVRYMEENVRRNRTSCVEPRRGDALALLAAVESPDRLIIDYPQDPEPAYRAAVSHVLPGGVVHYYRILESTVVEDRAERLVAAAKSADRSVEILAKREVHGWSATQKVFAFDLRIT